MLGVSLSLVSAVTSVEVHAQEAIVTTEENVRATPDGAVLGQVVPGTRVSVEGRQGGWTRVTIRGFVFVPSLQVWTEGPLDLVVSAEEGENLRDAPSGRIVGRLGNGTLLEEVRRIPGWIEVRREAWIWSASLDVDPGVAGAEVVAEAGPTTPASDDISSASPPATEAVSGPATRRVSAAGGAPLLVSPGGDTLAQLRPRSDLRVLVEDGDWARVQVEGWVWVPSLTQDAPAAIVEDPGAPASVPAGQLSQNPDAFEDRLVELQLEFISEERAERLRTDFYEGEPFLLTRSTDGARAFVYVAVAPERLSQVQGLSPLQEIRVVGRVRSSAAAFTGNPIVDLIEIERRP